MSRDTLPFMQLTHRDAHGDLECANKNKEGKMVMGKRVNNSVQTLAAGLLNRKSNISKDTGARCI